MRHIKPLKTHADEEDAMATLCHYWRPELTGLCSPLCIDCTDTWFVRNETDADRFLALLTTARRRVSRGHYDFSLHRVGLATSRLAVHIDAAVVPGWSF